MLYEVITRLNHERLIRFGIAALVIIILLIILSRWNRITSYNVCYTKLLRFVSAYKRVLEAVVDIERARFSTWYELFPRSCPSGDSAHGNFAGVIERLPAIAAMGFDVL